MPQVVNGPLLVVGVCLAALGLVMLLFGGSSNEVQGDNGSTGHQVYALIVEVVLIVVGVVAVLFSLA